MSGSVRAPFWLGDTIVRPELREIEDADGVRRIGDRAMDVLCCLAGRPGEVLSRQEILDEVWADLHIADEVVSTAVWELRRALGDQARSPRFIQTVPRRGYRLVATVRQAAAAADTEGPEASESTADFGDTLPAPCFEQVETVVPEPAWAHRGRRPEPRLWLAVAAGAVLISVALLVFLRGAPADTTVRSLAVLPIVALSSDPNDALLAQGIHDTLITDLAMLPGLRVSSRTTVMTYRDSQLTAPEIAAALAVDAIVEATLSRTGSELVLNAQLIHGASDRHLWASTYQRRITQLPALQVELARAIGGAVSARLHPLQADSPEASTRDTGPGGSLLRWQVRTGGELWSTPAVDRGTVFFGSRDGLLYAVDLTSGREHWRFATGGEIEGGPVVSEGTVVFGSTDHYLYALDARSGHERWRRRLRAAVLGAPAVTEGIAYAGDGSGTISAVTIATGEVLWTFATGAAIRGRLVVDGELLLAGSEDGGVYALDRHDGEPRWQVMTAGAVYTALAVDGDRVAATSSDHHVYLLDRRDGTELWRSRVPFGGTSPRWWHDRLLVAGLDGSCRAIDATTGTELWRHETLDAVITPMAAAGDDLVLCGSQDHSVYALDGWSGALRWRVELSNWITTEPVVAGDAVLVGSLDGSLYCIGLPEASDQPLLIRQADGFRIADDGPSQSRSHRVHVDAAGVEAGRLLWRFEADDRLDVPAGLADGRVFVGGLRSLWALDLADGHVLWRFPLSRAAGTRPQVARGLLVVGSRDGALYALDPATGEEQWRFRTGGDVISTPAISGDLIVFGSRDHHVYAVDTGSGREVWRFATDGVVHSSPTVRDGVVYVGSGDAHLYALEADSGRERWRLDTGDWVVAQPVADADSVYVGTADGAFLAVDRSSGAERWRHQSGGEIWFTPALVDGTVAFGSADYHLYALDTATGAERWRLATGNRVLSSVAVHGDTVLAGSFDRCVYAVSIADGAVRWRLCGAAAMLNPVVVGDHLLVVSHDRHLYVLRLPAAA
jgi:outer membrane protein assembly factor BamB/DNA-binding winged helix-turn-helix (wHTH) protein/TolB-like protein